MMLSLASPITEFPGITENSDFLGIGAGEASTGTTLLACEYKDGVLLAADCRTSHGSLVVNRETDKLTPVSDKILCCRSGSAADTQAIAKAIRYNLDMYNVMMGETAPVETVAHLFKSICYEYRDSLTAGILVGGWDKIRGGQVYSIPLGGMCVRQAYTSGGSGSVYLHAFMSANYKEGMNKEDCKKMLIRGIASAVEFDGSSGGSCRWASITKDGIEKGVVLYDELPTIR
uniref:proteasome endopeptidase complex n=1 Tax=Caligus clemensi TaxID=344056 RepID=C1C063_CALCM|nr:Proteasome subunit beta type-6 precursor [Caligus clemensi]